MSNQEDKINDLAQRMEACDATREELNRRMENGEDLTESGDEDNDYNNDATDCIQHQLDTVMNRQNEQGTGEDETNEQDKGESETNEQDKGEDKTNEKSN
ncbi:hypothetical protein I4U23_011375 [Adineta vaga]|nr:hypothetical protein I4U23_011375 [Adineta vaga]